MRGTLILWLILTCEVAAVLPAPSQQGGYRQGSLESDAAQRVYGNDPLDSWNRIFHTLFTRTVSLRLTEDFPEGAPFRPAGITAFRVFPALRVSDRIFERIETGDRGIDPLYPSFLDSRGARLLFTEPRYPEFKMALEAALDESKKRSPIERALMQSDLWAAYDLVHRNMRRVDGAQAIPTLKTLALLIRKLALTSEEIAALPDNYAAGATRHHLPDLFSEHSPWIEVEWGPSRLHDSSAGFRRSTRVFLHPGSKPMDMRGFLERFRSDRSPHAPLEAVALVTQCLLIGKSGDLVPTRIVTEVQVREFSRSPRGELSKTQIGEFELSRRAMLADPGSGGLAALGETSPAYLAAAGNDYAFATAIDSSDGKARDVAILGSLRARCVGCHGADVGTLFTFSKHDPLEGQIQILAKRLTEHAQYVIEQKMQLESWKSLQELWQQN